MFTCFSSDCYCSSSSFIFDNDEYTSIRVTYTSQANTSGKNEKVDSLKMPVAKKKEEIERNKQMPINFFPEDRFAKGAVAKNKGKIKRKNQMQNNFFFIRR
ncbi:hypothetical protein NE237_014585 [Protea cynaroides]|uniref:Uncharacterized protein n=1 Tax=Protea cynaroides TaxID=273540 RepID=A0A9Q0KCI0_9MAGN|nr:hypothetical protein NE237_014585 [Protea cynaroides]